MLDSYLSRVYTDLVSLPPSAEMTGERSLHPPATILRHHITVLTVQVTEQHLGCYRATMEEPTVTCEGITSTSMYDRTKAHLGTSCKLNCKRYLFFYSSVKITAKNRKHIGREKHGPKWKQRVGEEILSSWILPLWQISISANHCVYSHASSIAMVDHPSNLEKHQACILSYEIFIT